MSVLVSPSRSLRKHGRSMRAALLRAPGHFEIVDAPLPEPASNEVVIRIEGCGICGSNLPVWEGREWFRYPLEAGAPGHEAWGTVETIGPDVLDVEIGERVATLSYHAFAEYDVANANALVRLPADVREFPGEPLGCVLNIWQRCDIRPNEVVAIVGIGFIGAALTQLAAREGARVIAISRRPFALETAVRCGAWESLAWDDNQDVLHQVSRVTEERFCSRVIECVGTQQALDLATSLAGVRGRLVIAGYHQDGLRQVNMQQWNWRGLDVINAHEREPSVYRRGMELAVDAMRDGALSPAPLLTHRFDLENIDLGFHALAERPDGFLKAWIST